MPICARMPARLAPLCHAVILQRITPTACGRSIQVAPPSTLTTSSPPPHHFPTLPIHWESLPLPLNSPFSLPSFSILPLSSQFHPLSPSFPVFPRPHRPPPFPSSLPAVTPSGPTACSHRWRTLIGCTNPSTGCASSATSETSSL